MSDIFRRMKKPVLTALFVLLAALPLAAQTSEFGILAGGSRAIGIPAADGTSNQTGINDFHFGGSVKEVYFGTRVDPETVFRVRVGTADVALIHPERNSAGDLTGKRTAARGTVDHVDAIVDYRFSEPFGWSSIFGGIGMYRTRVPSEASDTNAGFTAGVNAGFPLTRRFGLMVEGSYHWTHTDIRQRWVTLTGGLRMSF
jgi:hypothetical protein